MRWFRLLAATFTIVLVSTAMTVMPGAGAATAGEQCPSGRVALTFDDGPTPDITERVLDELAARDVRATFFVVGGAAANHPELLMRTVNEGHVLGNHSWAHEDFTRRSDDQIRHSIVQTNDTIRAAVGRSPTLMRPPYGHTNERVSRVIATLGLVEKMWTLSSGDSRGLHPHEIARNVLSRLHPDAVVLQHDNLGSGRRTAEALPAIVDGARERGYCFGVLDKRGRVVESTSHPPQAIDRIAGATRYQTAVEISRTGWPGGAPAAIVVTGQRFPDGLTAASLAGVLGAPILLSAESSLPEPVGAELRRLGVQEIVVVGPIREPVVDELATLADEVAHVRGEDRYETAVLLAETATARGADASTTIVATGADFPDALAASSLAAAGPHPILLSHTGDDPERLREALDRLDAERVLVVGGADVIPESLVAGLGNVERLAGSERVSTAGAVATQARALGLTGPPMLASADAFPDALVAGPLAGMTRDGPVLLTRARTPSRPLFDWLREHGTGTLTVVGGPVAVAPRITCLLELGVVPGYACPSQEP